MRDNWVQNLDVLDTKKTDDEGSSLIYVLRLIQRSLIQKWNHKVKLFGI